MPDRKEVVEAIRASWSRETSGVPDQWTTENPAKGQCDVSSFVAWGFLGGELVLGKVLVDGEQIEHHYWNRIAGEDIDLTREQYSGKEKITEASVLGDEFLRTNQSSMKPEVMARIDLLRDAVSEKLGIVSRQEKATPAGL